MINEDIGELVAASNQMTVVSKRGKFGYAIFGPYIRQTAGSYTAEFEVSVDAAERNLFDLNYCDELCGFFDISTTGNVQIARTNIYLSRLSAVPRKFFLRFDLPGEDAVEMRVFSTGSVRLRINPDPVLRRLREPDHAHFLSMSTRWVAPLPFSQDEFRNLYEEGAEISPSDAGVVASFGGVAVLIQNSEDIQVANEVFISKDYDVFSRGRKIAIDIGMNAGFASLALAKDPTVMKVYSFEPFAAPFARANTNFNLNPLLKDKIFPRQVGLGRENIDPTVLVSESETIGTSIAGRTTGRPEMIHIREAAACLGPIFDEATSIGADIVLKVDCEGGEFPIFEALDRDGLLGMVRAVMVEWHKRMDGSKTQKHLIDILTRNDFVVFDTTRPSNLYAGRFNAVRVGT